VRFRLAPRENVFYELFSQSAEKLVEAAAVLRELVEASMIDRIKLEERLRGVEHEADELTHKILNEVNTTFVTPFDREDIYRLASRIDDVVDFMEAAGDLIVLYQIEDMPKELVTIADTIVQGSYLAREALAQLRTPGKLEHYFVEANKLENDADRLYRRFLADLFSGQYPTLEVLKLKEVVDQLEGAADALEHVANQVETIAVKDS
jgi:predicted phosphate transport protein (TIGR00153 family)